MPRARNEWLITGGLGAVLLVLAAWWWFGGDRQQAFITAVKAEVARVNEGDYGGVRDWFSPEFIARLERGGFADPRQAVLLARRMDEQQDATYAYRRLLYWDAESEDFAEVEFTRQTRDGGDVFALPFVHRDGRWWIADHFRTEEQGFRYLP